MSKCKSHQIPDHQNIVNQYLQYMKQYQPQDLKLFQNSQHNCHSQYGQLETLIPQFKQLIDQYHGYFHIQNEGLWDQIEIDCLPGMQKQQMYEQLLFRFEVYWMQKNMKLRFVKCIDDFSKLDLGLFQKIKIFEIDEFMDKEGCFDGDKFEQEIYQKQVCILRGIIDKFGFDNNIFTKEVIKQKYSKKHIDIISQNSLVHSFTLDKNSKQFRRRDKIGDYIKYIEEYVPQDNVDFAVNIDINDYKTLVSELRKLPSHVYTVHQELDSQSYFRQDVLGVSLAQMYLKVKGVWTGGHQENSRLRAININHGPDDSIWYTVDNQYYEKLRDLVKQRWNVDILKNEGLWFTNVEFLMEHGIPFKLFRQKKGDCVFLGPGCLHWVRSGGPSVQTAWNFSDYSQYQVEQIVQRYKENMKVNFDQLINIHTWFMDVLNHQTNQLHQKGQVQQIEMMLQQMKIQFDEEKELMDGLAKAGKIGQAEIQDSHINNTIFSCDNSSCKKECFMYFCHKQSFNNDYFYCIRCFQNINLNNVDVY